jgi:hypothetical protein
MVNNDNNETTKKDYHKIRKKRTNDPTTLTQMDKEMKNKEVKLAELKD